MKLQITLSPLFIILFLNNVYAETPETLACKSALEKGDVADALVQASKALDSNKNDRDALICLGRALVAKDDLNGALTAFKQADAQVGDAVDKAVSAMLIGNAYAALKQYTPAIDSYNAASTQAKASKNMVYERASYIALGQLYSDKQQYHQALAQFQLANKLDENDNERGESFEKVALAYHNMNQHDAALEYQVKGYLMQDKVGTLDQRVHAGIALGRYYGLVKNYTSAENILNIMIKFASDQGGAYYEAIASCVLARVKFAEGDKEAANVLVARAKLIAKDTHDNALAEEIASEIAGM
ncbi:MAG: hypothetical protein WBP13_02375 [Methylophilaceae bacterium]